METKKLIKELYIKVEDLRVVIDELEGEHFDREPDMDKEEAMFSNGQIELNRGKQYAYEEIIEMLKTE